MTDELNPVKVGTNKDFIDNQWKPGQSGNPNGRPPGIRYLSELARDILREHRKGDLEGKTTDELVVLALVKEALKGNTKAIEMLHDWTEGKVLDVHKIEGDIPVSIVYKIKENPGG